MTSPPKVTDEMVERALHAFWSIPEDLREDSIVLKTLRKTTRKALEAALSEPEEIPVSEGMIKAAFPAWFKDPAGSEDDDGFFAEGFAAVYRAMESKRREEAKEAAPYGADHAHQAAADPGAEKATGRAVGPKWVQTECEYLGHGRYQITGYFA